MEIVDWPLLAMTNQIEFWFVDLFHPKKIINYITMKREKRVQFGQVSPFWPQVEWLKMLFREQNLEIPLFLSSKFGPIHKFYARINVLTNRTNFRKQNIKTNKELH